MCSLFLSRKISSRFSYIFHNDVKWLSRIIYFAEQRIPNPSLQAPVNFGSFFWGILAQRWRCTPGYIYHPSISTLYVMCRPGATKLMSSFTSLFFSPPTESYQKKGYDGKQDFIFLCSPALKDSPQRPRCHGTGKTNYVFIQPVAQDRMCSALKQH